VNVILKPAQNYSVFIKAKLFEIAHDPFYMYAECGYSEEYKPMTDTWQGHEFVSVDDNDNILGYISYSINQRTNSVTRFYIVGFAKSVLFAKDLCQVVDNIFFKYHFNRMDFKVVKGNPVEKAYDKFIAKHGGRIVGIEKQVVRTLDGVLRDSKIYEILACDYK